MSPRHRAEPGSAPHYINARVSEEVYDWLRDRAADEAGSLSEALRQAVLLAMAVEQAREVEIDGRRHLAIPREDTTQ